MCSTSDIRRGISPRGQTVKGCFRGSVCSGCGGPFHVGSTIGLYLVSPVCGNLCSSCGARSAGLYPACSHRPPRWQRQWTSLPSLSGGSSVAIRKLIVRSQKGMCTGPHLRGNGILVRSQNAPRSALRPTHQPVATTSTTQMKTAPSDPMAARCWSLPCTTCCDLAACANSAPWPPTGYGIIC